MVERAVVEWLSESDKKASNVIYMLIFPNWKYYIGQTINELKVRVSKDHSLIKSSPNTNKDRAVNKYRTFYVMVLDTCKDLDELNVKEQYWIELYNTLDIKYGYNMMKGGDNHSYKWSDKQKLDQSIRFKGRIIDDKWHQNMIDNHADYRKDKHPSWGMKRTEQQCNNISKGLKDLGLTGSKSARSRKVICLNDGLTFDNIRLASEHYKIARSFIIASCKTQLIGQRGNNKNLSFAYFDDTLHENF